MASSGTINVASKTGSGMVFGTQARMAAPRSRRSLQTMNAVKEVFMPALSSTMTEGKIVSWLKSPGDKVKKGESIVVVESGKTHKFNQYEILLPCEHNVLQNMESTTIQSSSICDHMMSADKADMDVESFSEGILGSIVTNEGEVAGVGTPIAYIAETEADLEAAKAKAAGGTL